MAPLGEYLHVSAMANTQFGLCRTLVRLAEHRDKIARFSILSSPDLRRDLERWFGSLWLNMDMSHDAVIDFETEVAKVDRLFQ